jgi:hypothetical protein
MACEGCREQDHPRDVTGWLAWADNGQRYSSRAAQFGDLPDDGMLLLKLFYRDGRARILEGSDWYFMAMDGSGIPIFGQSTYNEPPDPARYRNLVVKRGRWVSDREMERIDAEAQAAIWEA